MNNSRTVHSPQKDPWSLVYLFRLFRGVLRIWTTLPLSVIFLVSLTYYVTVNDYCDPSFYSVRFLSLFLSSSTKMYPVLRFVATPSLVHGTKLIIVPLFPVEGWVHDTLNPLRVLRRYKSSDFTSISIMNIVSQKKLINISKFYKKLNRRKGTDGWKEFLDTTLTRITEYGY